MWKVGGFEETSRMLDEKQRNKLVTNEWCRMRKADAEERRLAAQVEKRRMASEERKIGAEERRIAAEEKKLELEVEKLR